MNPHDRLKKDSFYRRFIEYISQAVSDQKAASLFDTPQSLDFPQPVEIKADEVLPISVVEPLIESLCKKRQLDLSNVYIHPTFSFAITKLMLETLCGTLFQESLYDELRVNFQAAMKEIVEEGSCSSLCDLLKVPSIEFMRDCGFLPSSENLSYDIQSNYKTNLELIDLAEHHVDLCQRSLTERTELTDRFEAILKNPLGLVNDERIIQTYALPDRSNKPEGFDDQVYAEMVAGFRVERSERETKIAKARQKFLTEGTSQFQGKDFLIYFMHAYYKQSAEVLGRGGIVIIPILHKNHFTVLVLSDLEGQFPQISYQDSFGLVTKLGLERAISTLFPRSEGWAKTELTGEGHRNQHAPDIINCGLLAAMNGVAIAEELLAGQVLGEGPLHQAIHQTFPKSATAEGMKVYTTAFQSLRYIVQQLMRALGYNIDEIDSMPRRMTVTGDPIEFLATYESSQINLLYPEYLQTLKQSFKEDEKALDIIASIEKGIAPSPRAEASAGEALNALQWADKQLKALKASAAPEDLERLDNLYVKMVGCFYDVKINRLLPLFAPQIKKTLKIEHEATPERKGRDPRTYMGAARRQLWPIGPPPSRGLAEIFSSEVVGASSAAFLNQLIGRKGGPSAPKESAAAAAAAPTETDGPSSSPPHP